MTPRQIAYRILTIQAKQDDWFDSVNSIDGVEIQDPIGGDGLLVDVVCDILDYPDDDECLEGDGHTCSREMMGDVLDYPDDDECLEGDGHTWSREMMGDVWFELRGSLNRVPLFLDIVERKRRMPKSYGGQAGTLLEYMTGTDEYRAERDVLDCDCQPGDKE